MVESFNTDVISEISYNNTSFELNNSETDNYSYSHEKDDVDSLHSSDREENQII